MAFDETEKGLRAGLMTLRFRKLGMNQEQFATRFGIPVGTIRDLEQMRTNPSHGMHVLVEAIDLDPALGEQTRGRRF